MLGAWDVSREACGRSFAYSTTKLGVGPERLRFHYGHADVAEIAVSRADGRLPVAFVRGALLQEGTLDGAEDAFYRIEHRGSTDTLRLTWKDVGQTDLVRCTAS